MLFSIIPIGILGCLAQGCRSGAWESQDVELAQKSEFIPSFRHPVHAKASMKLWDLSLLILEEIEPASSDWRCGFSDAWRSFNVLLRLVWAQGARLANERNKQFVRQHCLALQATLSSRRARPIGNKWTTTAFLLLEDTHLLPADVCG